MLGPKDARYKCAEFTVEWTLGWCGRTSKRACSPAAGDDQEGFISPFRGE